LWNLLCSAFWVAGYSATHPGSGSDNLAKCARLLEEQGFTVRKLRESSIYAKRGSLFIHSVAEQEWREFKMRVMVTATGTGSSSTLDVLSVCLIGVRLWFVPGCRAIAELDEPELTRLSRTIPARQRGLSLSGLGNKISGTLAIFSIISVAVTLWLAAIASKNSFEYVVGNVMQERLFNRLEHVLDTLDLPARHDIYRQLKARGTDSGLSVVELLSTIEPGTAEGRLVIALKQPDDTVTLVLPRQGTALEPIARAIFLEGIGDSSTRIKSQTGPLERVEKAGDRIFVRFSSSYHGELASQLGLKGGGQLAVGLLLSYPELASLAPSFIFEKGTELTYYRYGNPILHYAWSAGSVVVDQGAGALPSEVIMQTMDFETDKNNYFVNLFWRRKSANTFRVEMHDGNEYMVKYFGSFNQGSWSGWSFAVHRYDMLWLATYYYPGLVVAYTGVAAMLALLFLVFICSPIIAARISRPVLAVRDALRSISEGDYSVRLKEERKDEIGQLQQMVNHTAEELHKRESVKDLMGKYLSKQVADRIMESDSGEVLAGVRREVSVLFADVRGFTTYSEKHDPEQVTKSLNEYFEVMVDVIAVHEGVLDKYIGDGLMVVFGAPMTQEDHARRAVITALEMQAALQSLNLKRLQRGDDPINIGIGVNTGLAISGNLGSLKRMEFTVIGDTVNTAARLESNAKQGQILIGRGTYQKVTDLIECESLGPIPVKGKAEPVEVWWLKGLKARAK
jgi:class 3 adenylate cyclase